MRKLALALALSLAGGVAHGAISGSINQGGQSLRAADAFAYDCVARMRDEPALCVRVFAAPIDHQTLGGLLAPKRALDELDGPYAELELSPTGEWQGMSYDLGQSASCGYCTHNAVRGHAKLRVENGAVRGTVMMKVADYPDKDGPGMDLVLDVPISRPVGVTALTAGGGDPGKAFLACNAAVVQKRPVAEVAAICLAADDSHAEASELSELTDAFRGIGLDKARITGGRLLGDQAELVVTGVDPFSGDTTERVSMRRTAAGWRVVR